MSATGAGYDLSVTTFSPDGRVFQIEYAAKGIEKSGTAIGIRCVDGVVVGAEKVIISKMILPSSNRRVHTVGMHNGITLSGIAADARQIVNRGREEVRSYKSFYGENIPGKVLVDRIAGFMHAHTLYWYYRPFGCSVLIGTNGDDGPELYQVDPSGVSHRFFATAIGKNKEAAKSELEKLDFTKITCKKAVFEIARIIYKLHDDSKDKNFKLEMSWSCEESDKIHAPVPEDILGEACKAAIELKKKEELDDDDDDDDDDDE